MNFLSLNKQLSSYLKMSFVSRKLKSSMTIYLSVVLILIMALICTLIESGRVSAINARLRSISYMAADSVFAEFAQPVFDRYGVLLLWTDEGEYLEKYNDYITQNLDLAGTGAGMDMDLYGMQFKESALSDVTWLVDENGAAFEEQVYDYMKVHVIEGLAEKLLSQTDFFEQTESAREVLGTINEYQKEFTKVEESVADLSNQMNHIKDLAENPKTILDEMQETLDRYEAGEDPQIAAEYMSEREELAYQRDALSAELSTVQEKSEAYYQNVEAVRGSVEEMRAELKQKEADYDPEIYQALENRIKEIEDTGSESGEGYRQIASNAEAAAAYQEMLSGLDDYFAETAGGVTAENVGTLQTLTEQYRNSIESFDLSSLGVGTEETEGGKVSTAFVSKVNNTYNSGLLDLLAGEVSDKQIDKSSFPSVTCGKEKTEDSEEGIVDKTVQKALFCEYVMEHFGNFRNVKEGTALEYEAEYILGGKDNDRDNLSSVVTKLVLLRCGANLLNLLVDGTKRLEIQELAAAISCGQVYVYRIAEAVITFVWALAEAILDMKALLDGKKIAIYKQGDDWFLSLEGLQNFTGDEAVSSDEQNGLSYEDYLRILLLMENRYKQTFRTMDMIQANMCLHENGGFRMKDCMVAATASVRFSAPGVFASLPIVRRTVDTGSSGYEFAFTQSYAY